MNSLFLKRSNFLFFLLILGSVIAGCTSPVIPVLPTVDEGAIVAAVVETINAQNTTEAINNPSATPVPTETQPPPSPTPIPITETPTETAQPSETPTQITSVSAKLMYVVAYPEDKRSYVGNERFGIAIGFQNTGTVTWEPGSYVKLVSNNGEVTVQLEAFVTKAVAPGEKAEYDHWAYGSEWYGDHTFVFQLYNSQGLPISGGYATFTYTSV
ncbi:MAG: hypothetical protein Q7U53_12095 [Anaerolineaceae bacterium]|nr:hypothetical protein [Anaerolineaceae bacterium]